jgi:hypothetical protein
MTRKMISQENDLVAYQTLGIVRRREEKGSGFGFLYLLYTKLYICLQNFVDPSVRLRAFAESILKRIRRIFINN